MKKQIIFIHGGEVTKNKESFYKYLRTTNLDPFKDKRKWGDFLADNLGNKYEVIKPVMPSKYEVDYKAWKIWFERHLDFINYKNPILIGHSLGATFLLKYLSENNFPKKVSQLHLIAPAISGNLFDFNVDLKKINKISKNCTEIHLWHSEDDEVVSFKDSIIVKENIHNIIFHVFKKRGHFVQKSFPEILEVIKKAK